MLKIVKKAKFLSSRSPPAPPLSTIISPLSSSTTRVTRRVEKIATVTSIQTQTKQIIRVLTLFRTVQFRNTVIKRRDVFWDRMVWTTDLRTTDHHRKLRVASSQYRVSIKHYAKVCVKKRHQKHENFFSIFFYFLLQNLQMQNFANFNHTFAASKFKRPEIARKPEVQSTTSLLRPVKAGLPNYGYR